MSHSTIYDKIGEGYNKTRKADPYIAARLFDLLQPQQNSTYLDIGCGTGNYTIALNEMGVNLTGVDPSEKMLQEARAKNNNIIWTHGYAETISFNNQHFDGIIATLTMHHWTHLENAFLEIARVLKPHGKFVVFTFTPLQESGYWFNHYFPEMMKKSIKKAIPQDIVINAATNAGFTLQLTETYDVQPNLQDMFGYSGKHNPEIYFDHEIRKGISSFTLLADQEEVKTGLKLLRETIDDGNFEQIKNRYKNPNGDYLFMVFERN